MGEEVRVQEKKSGSLYKGLLVGGAIAVGLVLAKKEWRTKVISECKQMTKSTSDAIRFVRDHREEITTQVKQVSNDVSQAIKGITTDIKTMRETVSHLKESSEEIIEATKGVAEDVKKLKNE